MLFVFFFLVVFGKSVFFFFRVRIEFRVSNCLTFREASVLPNSQDGCLALWPENAVLPLHLRYLLVRTLVGLLLPGSSSLEECYRARVRIQICLIDKITSHLTIAQTILLIGLTECFTYLPFGVLSFFSSFSLVACSGCSTLSPEVCHKMTISLCLVPFTRCP